MFPIHVLYIRPNCYEVCSDDGRLSREFPNRKEADIYADALRKGKNDLDAMALVETHRKRRDGAKARMRAAYAAKRDAMDSIGMKRNRDGSFE